MARRVLVVAASTAALLLGTVLVFIAFDRYSHSVSDTVRPFVITMAPVWLVAVTADVILLRDGVRTRVRRQ